MKTSIALLTLLLSLSASAQWSHYGEEPVKTADCSTYHWFELPECQVKAEEWRKEKNKEYQLYVAKRKHMESDPNYIQMLSLFEGCEGVEPFSKNLDKMNQAELCRRQLTDQLETDGYFKNVRP